MQVAHERVRSARRRRRPALSVGGVAADVADEEIEQAIVVVVEEDGAGGVRRRDRGPPAFVMSRKCPRAVVLEQRVAAANGRDEEILVAVVVGVGERRGDADPVRQADAGLPGDVLNRPPPRFFQSSLPPT